MRTVLVTGATGFLGLEVSRRLMALGYRVVGLVKKVTDDLAIIPMVGDLLDNAPWGGPQLTYDAVIHCAGHHPGERVDVDALHVQGTRRILDEARRRGIRRLIFISALGADMTAATRFQRSKAEAEALVKASDVEWTILRPHLMFGHGSRTFRQLEEAAGQPWAALPESRVLLQPVYVGDVAELAIRSLWLPRTIGQTYNVSGPQSMRLEDIIRHIARDLHWFRIFTIPVPKKYAYMVLSRLGRAGPILTGPEWDYLQQEMPAGDPRWLIDYGLIPHSLALFYSPLA